MSKTEISQYYADTFDSKIRSDLALAISLVAGDKSAIDCGCGSGSDIKYLRENGFTVHAFDIEDEAIKICGNRFKGDDKVYLSRDSFYSFEYPKVSLILADASLFFCPQNDFEYVWNQIYESLTDDGIFYGSFLGPKDTMASPNFDRGAYWNNILVFEEKKLKEELKNFEIIEFKEHNVSGKSSNDDFHKWHIFSVVAKKV